jgi:hypothetical protein
MNVTKNGITITIPDAEVIRVALDRFGEIKPLMLTGLIAPRIGEVWDGEGGVYAGIARGRDGAPDYHLVVGPEFEGTQGWDAAIKWAANLSVDELKDFALPFRKEQALCFANVSELFKPEWYWSCEQHASISSYAWGQGFGGGSQSYWGNDGRARAVRRLVIQ